MEIKTTNQKVTCIRLVKISMCHAHVLFINLHITLSDGEYIQTEEGLQRQGYGVHTTCEGLSYHGRWSGDKMNGQGEYDFKLATDVCNKC